MMIALWTTKEVRNPLSNSNKNMNLFHCSNVASFIVLYSFINCFMNYIVVVTKLVSLAHFNCLLKYNLLKYFNWWVVVSLEGVQFWKFFRKKKFQKTVTWRLHFLGKNRQNRKLKLKIGYFLLPILGFMNSSLSILLPTSYFWHF
jgi:hypothetical protein